MHFSQNHKLSTLTISHTGPAQHWHLQCNSINIHTITVYIHNYIQIINVTCIPVNVTFPKNALFRTLFWFYYIFTETHTSCTSNSIYQLYNHIRTLKVLSGGKRKPSCIHYIHPNISSYTHSSFYHFFKTLPRHHEQYLYYPNHPYPTSIYIL